MHPPIKSMAYRKIDSAADSCRYPQGIPRAEPARAAFNIGDMLQAYDALRAHAASPHHITLAMTRWSHAAMPGAAAGV